MPPLLRFATFLAPNMRPVYEFIATTIGAELGYTTELHTGVSFAQFARGEIDVGFICGLPYVELARQQPPPVELLAAPVLTGARYGGQPIYFSDVIVRRTSTATSFSDLRGCVWAYNDPDSHSGYNLVRYHLVRLGETRGFFRQVVEAGWHQQALRLVCDGTVDAAAIDSQVLAIELRDHPALGGQVKVIATLGPSTIQPVVAASHLPAPVKAALQEALVRLGDDPAARRVLAYGDIATFIRVRDTRYDDIRRMLGAVEEADFMLLK